MAFRVPLIQGGLMSSSDLESGDATGKQTALLALAALGGVFGNIGTAPLLSLIHI